jgi:cytochrome P450
VPRGPIAKADADPGLAERADILAFLLRTDRGDETGMPRLDICDELLTLTCAGHETTAQHWPGRLSACGATQTC